MTTKAQYKQTNKTKRTHRQLVVRFSMGGETNMKRLLGIVTILCMGFSLSTSAFADRILLIPDVPKRHTGAV